LRHHLGEIFPLMSINKVDKPLSKLKVGERLTTLTKSKTNREYNSRH